MDRVNGLDLETTGTIVYTSDDAVVVELDGLLVVLGDGSEDEFETSRRCVRVRGSVLELPGPRELVPCSERLLRHTLAMWPVLPHARHVSRTKRHVVAR